MARPTERAIAHFFLANEAAHNNEITQPFRPGLKDLHQIG
jgi:hypothetical protein